MSVTREKLFEEVWAEPMTTVAARYEVSSVYLARVCRWLKVPHPPRGYWARVRAGQKPKKPPLPKHKFGDPTLWSRGDGDVEAQVPPEPPKLDPSQPFRRLVGHGSRHPLVVGLDKVYEQAQVSDIGFLRPWKRALVDVYVTKEALARALKVAGTIFNAMERRGYRVTLGPYSTFWRPEIEKERQQWQWWTWERWRPDRPTVTYVGTVAIGLTIYETYEDQTGRKVGDRWVRAKPDDKPLSRLMPWESPIETRHVPTGLFVLRAFSPYPYVSWTKTWAESRRGELRNLAEQIADELEQAASVVAHLVEEKRRRDEEHRLKMEAERLERERREMEQRRVQALKDSREQLLAIVERWALANSIEAFFRDLVSRSQPVLDEEAKAALLLRIDEARALLGSTDALENFRSWRSPKER